MSKYKRPLSPFHWPFFILILLFCYFNFALFLGTVSSFDSPWYSTNRNQTSPVCCNIAAYIAPALTATSLELLITLLLP